MVSRLTSCGILLVLFVPLAWLKEGNTVPSHEPNVEFRSERNDQNFTDDVYGFINNDLVKISTKDNRNRIQPTRQMVKNPTVFIQTSVTPKLHESINQNRAVQESVGNKNEGTTSTTSGTMKDGKTDYSATNRTPRGLDATTNGGVLQLSVIRGARDKGKESSLAHNTHLGSSASVLITSGVFLPTRTRSLAQATAVVVPSERTHDDLEKGLVQVSPLPGTIRGISDKYVTRIHERALSYSLYASISATSMKSKELQFAPESRSLSSLSSSPAVSSSPSSSLTSSTMASSPSSSLTSSVVSSSLSTSSIMASSPSSTSSTLASSPSLKSSVVSSSLQSSLTSAIMESPSSLTSSTSSLSLLSPSSSSILISPSSLTSSTSSLSLLLPSSSSTMESQSPSSSSLSPSSSSSSVLSSLSIVDSKELPSSSSEAAGTVTTSLPSSSAIAAVGESPSHTVMEGSSRNGQSPPSHQVRTMEAVPTPVSTSLLQSSSSLETPSLLSSQENTKIFSSSLSTTAIKGTSPLWTSHPNQALSSSPSLFSSSSSEAAGIETPLLLSSQLHQGFSSSLTSLSPSSSSSLSSSSSSSSTASSLLSSSSSLSLSSSTSKAIAVDKPLLKSSLLYQGVLPSSASSATTSLPVTQEFSPSSSSPGETPDLSTTLQNQDHSFSTLSLETSSSLKNRKLLKSATSTKTEIAKSFAENSALILSSPIVASQNRVSPSQQNATSKQDVIFTGIFTSRCEKATVDLLKSTKTLSVHTHSISVTTNMAGMPSSTLPVREESTFSLWSPSSLPTPSPSVYSTMASSTSSLIKTDPSGESSTLSASLLPAIASHKNVGERIKPTNSLLMQHLPTDANTSASLKYSSMLLLPSPSSSASFSILHATSDSSASSSSTTTTSSTSTHSVAFTSASTATATTTSPSSSQSAKLSSLSTFPSFPSTSPPELASSSSSSSLHDHQSPFQLDVTSTMSNLLKSATPSVSPTPSLRNTHSLVQSSSSVSPSKQFPVTTTPFNSTRSRSHEENKIDNQTEQTSRKSQFILTTVLSGLPTKASMAQESYDLPSSNLSTDFNGPSIRHGSVIKRTAWTPSMKPFSSQTETSTAMSTNTPLYKLTPTLSIVSSIDGFPNIHRSKSHEGMSSISTSAPSQLVGMSVDSSRNVNFIKTAETKPTLIKASPTAVSKGIISKFMINPSLSIEYSRTSETGTHSLHTKGLASSKDTTSMRGSLTTRKMGVSAVSSRILVSTSISSLRPTRTSGLRQQTIGVIRSANPNSTFSTNLVLFPKSSSLNSERHSTIQKIVQSSSTQEKPKLTRSSATLKSSTSTSGGFPDVSKSASKETRSKPLGNPQDSMVTTDVEISESPLTPSMAFHTISPTSTLYTFPSSTAISDANISMVTTSDGTDTGTKSNDDPNNKILLFIIIAIIPTLLLLILIAIFLFRRVKERESEPFYKIQVEYTDDNKQRRPRCANSRLDLTIKGMHIDLEFPSPGEKRKSARLSAPPNLSDVQMRELQKLSLECKENLEWINEVLERELDTPVFLGGSSSSENDDSMDASCINQRCSVYSACSEKEKENYEASEKIIVRDSPKHTKRNENDDDDDNNDSEASKNDSDELKIQLDQRTSPKVPSKPELPPKPKIKLTAADRMGTSANPLASTIFIECSACEDESKAKKIFDPVLTKNNTPKERTLLKKPPIPERKGTLSRKPEKALRKPEVSLTVENESKKESPCLCNRLSTSKPPIPKKPEGLVINRFERKANDGANGRVTTTLYRSGMKLNVCCASRKACQAV